MNESGTKAVVCNASPMSMGQTLQMLIAEQRLDLNDFLFIPGPAVPPWIKNKIPIDYHDTILVENKNGQMVPQEIQQHVIGEIVAEEGDKNDQYELREVLVSPEHQLDLIPKLKLI